MSDPEDVLARASQEICETREAVRRGRGRDRRKRAPKSYAPRTACPVCQSLDSRVVDPRPLIGSGDGTTYWRVRACSACHAIYSTEEVPRAIIAGVPKSA